MDNTCIFNNWKVTSIKYVGEGAKKRAEFAITSRTPNSAGVWNKNFCAAFGKKAEQLEKLDVQKGSIISIVAFQQAYMDKTGVMRNNYLVQSFDVIELEKKSQSDTSVQAPKEDMEANIMTGYNEMMAFMQ